MHYDLVIIGAGIVGLATAQEILLRAPHTRIAILEKEPRPGLHASGRNSGVLHCGIYYGADTLKAKVCATGSARMRAFAAEHDLPCTVGGKLVLATQESQLPTVDKLLKNARDNGIRAERISHEEAKKIEPNAAEGVAAIFCPDTAVIDSPAVVKKLSELLAEKGVAFHFDTQVLGASPEQKLLHTTQGDIGYGKLINTAGAHADRIARLFGLAGDYVLVPFKGIYWKLSAEANPKLRSNIYPVPDTSLPFLGVHITRVISGDVYLGPTAIPVLGRENYHGITGMDLAESARIFTMFARMYGRNSNQFRRLAHLELGKYSKRRFHATAQRLMPSLRIDEMVPTGKAGIRPQLVNRRTGTLEMDYIFESTEDTLHVLNTISPAFTSAFAFAEMIADKAGYGRVPAR